MNNRRRTSFIIVGILLWMLIGGLYLVTFRKPTETAGLDKILASGEVTTITRSNPWCYYRYGDQPMGFEYELAKAFADYLGVSLKVRIAQRWDNMIPDLLAGKGDFIAAGMTITPERNARAAFSAGYLPAEPYVITRRGAGASNHSMIWREKPSISPREHPITND